jgi:hypothetical protein
MHRPRQKLVSCETLPKDGRGHDLEVGALARVKDIRLIKGLLPIIAAITHLPRLKEGNYAVARSEMKRKS